MVLPSSSTRRAPAVIEGGDRPAGVPLDPLLGEGAEQGPEASGEGGMGTGRGMTRATSERSLRPRSRRNVSVRSAASLGAGGHLNGVEVTPTTTRPPSNPSSTSRRANAPSTV